MSDKPIFDTPEGRNFLDKMKEGIELLTKLKKDSMSSDPLVRKQANEQMREHIEKAQELIEKIKSGKSVDVKKLGGLLADPANFTPEQRELFSYIERMTKQLFSDEPHMPKVDQKEPQENKKKGSKKQKWMKS